MTVITGIFRAQQLHSSDSSTNKSHEVFLKDQQLHGAMSLDEGERYNLVISLRSSSIRNVLCPRCDTLPLLVKTECEGDGFSKKVVHT